MNKIAYLFILLLIHLSCSSQDKRKEIYETRRSVENIFSGKILEPCLYPDKILDLLKNKPVGTRSQKFTLFERKINSDTYFKCAGYFVVGENDCIIHSFLLYAEKNGMTDSLLVDYFGDSFGTISLKSKIKFVNDKISVLQKESEILIDYEENVKVNRQKNIEIILNNEGYFELVDKKLLLINKDEKLFSLKEYFEDHYKNLKIISQDINSFKREKYALIVSENNSTNEINYYVFINFESPFFNKVFYLGKCKKEEKFINKIKISYKENGQKNLEIIMNNSKILKIILENDKKGNLTYNKYIINNNIFSLPNSKSIKEIIAFAREFK
jgi:hypothetical protein